MRTNTTKILLAGALIATMTASPVLAAGKFNVIELNYKSRFGKELQFHFQPTDGFSLSACKKSLAPAIAEYGPNFDAAIKKNFHVELAKRPKLTLIDGKCKAFDFPPGQTMKLKLSGQ